MPEARRAPFQPERASTLLGQFCANPSSWSAQERRDKIDTIAQAVSRMNPKAQADFCVDRFQTAIQSDLISLEDSLMFCKSLLLRDIHTYVIRYAVQSIFLHPAFQGAADLPPRLVAEAAVFVFVADPQARTLASPTPFPLFCPFVLVGTIARIRQLANEQFGMLAPHTTANIAPHWNVLTHLFADDSMT